MGQFLAEENDVLFFRFRQTGKRQQQRGHRAEGAGGEDAQPVDVAQHGGAGADIGQGGFGKGADCANAGRFQPVQSKSARLCPYRYRVFKYVVIRSSASLIGIPIQLDERECSSL